MEKTAIDESCKNSAYQEKNSEPETSKKVDEPESQNKPEPERSPKKNVLKNSDDEQKDSTSDSENSEGSSSDSESEGSASDSSSSSSPGSSSDSEGESDSGDEESKERAATPANRSNPMLKRLHRKVADLTSQLKFQETKAKALETEKAEITQKQKNLEEMLELQAILDEKNNSEITELLQQKQEVEIAKEKLLEALEITNIEHKQEITDINKRHEAEMKQIREDMEILVFTSNETETELKEVKEQIEKYKEEIVKAREQLSKVQTATGLPLLSSSTTRDCPSSSSPSSDLEFEKPKRAFTQEEEKEIASQENKVLEEMGFTKDQLKSLGMKHSRHKVRTVILSKQAKLGFLSGVNLQEERAQEEVRARLANLSREELETQFIAQEEDIVKLRADNVDLQNRLNELLESLKKQKEAAEQRAASSITPSTSSSAAPSSAETPEKIEEDEEAAKMAVAFGYSKDQLKALGRKHSRHEVRTMILRKQALLGFLLGGSHSEEAGADVTSQEQNKDSPPGGGDAEPPRVLTPASAPTPVGDGLDDDDLMIPKASISFSNETSASLILPVSSTVPESTGSKSFATAPADASISDGSKGGDGELSSKRKSVHSKKSKSKEEDENAKEKHKSKHRLSKKPDKQKLKDDSEGKDCDDKASTENPKEKEVEKEKKKESKDDKLEGKEKRTKEEMDARKEARKSKRELKEMRMRADMEDEEDKKSKVKKRASFMPGLLSRGSSSSSADKKNSKLEQSSSSVTADEKKSRRITTKVK